MKNIVNFVQQNKFLLFNPISVGVATGFVVGNARATSRKENFSQRIESTKNLMLIFGMFGGISPIWLPLGIFKFGFRFPYDIYDSLVRTAKGERMDGWW